MNLKVCEGCLSVNRILKTVNERERKLFYNFIYTNYSKNHLELCWECRALLKKFLRFKLQVRQARDVLDCFVVHHTILNSLSSLRTTQCKFEVVSSVECSQETISLPSVKIEVDKDVQDFTAEKLFDNEGVDKEALVNALRAEMDTIENELTDDESYINGATSAVSETDTTFEQNQHTTECQNVVVCSVLCKEREDPSLISVKIEDDKDVLEDFSPGNTFNDDDMGLMINVSHSLNTEIDLKIDIIENETIGNENNTEDLFDCSDDELHMIKEKKRTSKIKRRMSLNGIEHVPKLSKPQNGYHENSTGSDSTSSGNEHMPMRRIIEDINVPSTKHGDFSTPRTFDNTSNDIQKLHIPSATTELEDPAVKRRKTINNLIRHLFLKHADEEDLKNCLHLSKKSEERIKTIASFPKRDDFPDKRRLAGDIHPCASETLWRKIFPIFKNDAIVRCIKYDEIIIKFGNKLCEQYTLTHQHEHIRAQLRLLGRLKNEMMILDETIFELMSVFDPKQFDNLIKSIKIIASWNEQIMWYDLPSVAQNLTTLIKKCAKKLRVECIKSEDNNRKSLVENFLLLWEEKMPTIINKKALENQVTQKQRKKAILPARSDITLLYNYLQEQCLICLEILTDEFQNNAWVLLIQSTLILIQVLNGRRAGEIERLTLIDYENKTSLNENVVPGIYNKLSDNAREYAAQYKRLTIRGERGRIVPVLLSPIAVICIDLIIKYRKEAKIASSNEYIFSKPNGSKLSKPYFRARPLMRRFANDCYVLIPSALRGTTLRKLIAPYIGMLNIKESHVDRLAYIMGNNKDILKNIYRMPVPVAEMADVSRLLRSAIGDDDEEGNEASDEENSDSSDEDVNDGNDDPELDTHENTNKRKSSHTLISENGETY